MQNEAKHTPGPWSSESGHIHAGEGCEFYCYFTRHSPVGRANARLIAAAPELLAALKAAEYALSEQDHLLSIGIDALQAVRAAIAKAEGRES